MTVLVSVIISSPHHITAQTLESILQERNAFKNNLQINLGGNLTDIAFNSGLNKVYVTDSQSNSVFIINSNSGNITKIFVGLRPTAIAIDDAFSNKVYVVNSLDNTVSVIASSDKKEPKDVPVGKDPTAIAFDYLGVVPIVFSKNSAAY